MKACILAVCHNSYDEAFLFLCSISDSVKNTSVDLDVYFIDNSTEFSQRLAEALEEMKVGFRVRYIRSENLGYLPSIASTIEKYKIRLQDYDYSCISNVDLTLDPDFFPRLEKIEVNSEIGIYAPAILSSALHVDRNPKIVKRPSVSKLKLNRWLFKYAFSHLMLRLVNVLRLQVKQYFKFDNTPLLSAPVASNKMIYAPHGSFMILTKEFVKSDDKLNYPIFLFCEEIYLAEKAIEFGLFVAYRPDLVVFDSEHVSTSLMKPSSYRKQNFEALSYILTTYKRF
jgi:hypothetical protein